MRSSLFLVAGPGIEPGSGGYEPPEVPLLYPAMYTTLNCPKIVPLTAQKSSDISP